MNGKICQSFASLSMVRRVYQPLLIGLLIIAGCLFSTGNAYARCINVNIAFDNIPNEINVVGKKVGDELYQYNNTISGTCTKGNVMESEGQYLYFLAPFKTIPEGQWCTDANPATFARMTDPTGHVEFQSTDIDCHGGAYYVGAFKNTNSGVTGPLSPMGSRGVLKLKKTFVGKITVDPYFFWTGQYSSMLGGYPRTLHNEDANVTGLKRSITLINTPACSAKVNDVNFGDAVSQAAVQSASLSGLATVQVSCEAILPSYTITLSSVNGSASSAEDIINSVNPTIGYRLAFQSGDTLKLNTALTPGSLPQKSDFTIPITVVPVSLVNDAKNIQPGSANSSISIELKFN